MLTLAITALAVIGWIATIKLLLKRRSWIEISHETGKNTEGVAVILTALATAASIHRATGESFRSAFCWSLVATMAFCAITVISLELLHRQSHHY